MSNRVIRAIVATAITSSAVTEIVNTFNPPKPTRSLKPDLLLKAQALAKKMGAVDSVQYGIDPNENGGMAGYNFTKARPLILTSSKNDNHAMGIIGHELGHLSGRH